MQEVKEISLTINEKLDNLKSGTLCFFGDWFGRPMDNIHSIVGSDADGEILEIHFDGGESMKVWSPDKVNIGSNVFRIEEAWKVRWEWYYYGRPHTEENKYFCEYVRELDKIVGTSNVDWYEPSFKTNINSPAVEIV